MATSGNGSKAIGDFDSYTQIPGKVRRQFDNGKSDWIGRVESDTKPILYLSGTSGSKTWSEELFKKTTGCKYRCLSYAYCGPNSPLYQQRHGRSMDWCLNHGVRMFVDSGAHTFHKMLTHGTSLAKGLSKDQRLKKATEISDTFLELYATFIKWCYATNRHFDFHVTLDWKKNCRVIREATNKLFSLGIHPVPVYHGDSSLDWVRRYIDDGHKLIGIGLDLYGKASKLGRRRYFDMVFNLTELHGVACHGFAVTGDWMFEFPWYSVDSLTWLKAAAFGKIIDIRPEKQRVALIHVSDHYSERTAYGKIEALAPGTQKALRNSVESRGFDFDLIRQDITYRSLFNAKVFVDAVKVHTKRGGIWKNWIPLL